MTIKLNIITDLYEFVKKASTYAEDISVKQNGQVINGKSILGLLSLNLTKTVEVEIVTDKAEVKEEFYSSMGKYANE